MTHENLINTGEQLTFYQLFADKHWKVEIPIIQRDYAQGRKSAEEVRTIFLETLYKHLQSGKNLDLDFIYGSVEGNSNNLFVPLDGQQRLTTLFLLHWYLAKKEGKMEHFREFILSNEKKSKFTYETRASAREFCTALLKRPLPFDDLRESDKNKRNSISKTIEDQTWYFLSWRNDPTIQAMLTMLDDIHLHFSESDGFFDKLISTERPVITFQFLDLEKSGLSDDLYIKMNARGKPLTAFENFKAKLEQQIKGLEIKKTYQLQVGNVLQEVSAYDYFVHKIDTDWADLFWNYRNHQSRDNTFDDELMNFIRMIITNHFAVKSSDEQKTEHLQLLLGGKGKEQHLSFLKYQKYGVIDEELITDLIAIFDKLSNGNKAIKTYLPNSSYYNEDYVFKSALVMDTSYPDKLRLYAFYKYLIYNETDKGINDWMRVIYNLTENTIYDKPEDFARSIKSIKQLLPNSPVVLKHISKTNTSISGFSELVEKEEKLKAGLMLKGDEWRKAIIDAEQHPYFTGQIGFMLNFSGIETYWSDNNHLNWSNSDNSNYLFSFKDYYVKAKTVFKEDSFKSLQKNYLWERSMLSKGDYLLKEGSNLSFCIYAKDRDIGWKRFLFDGGKRQDYPGHEKRRQRAKAVFEDPDFSVHDLQGSLGKIISKYKGNQWYKPFIEMPTLFNYLGPKKYIRKESNTRIYLLKRERMSASHAELYSYAFYLNYLLNNKDALYPFTEVWYNDPSGREEEPHAVIDKMKIGESNIKIKLFYLFDDKRYKIEIVDSTGNIAKTDIPGFIHKQKLDYNSDNTSFIRTLGNSTTIMFQVLTKLCSDLKESNV